MNRPSILEAAPLQVMPGRETAFEAAFHEAQAIIASMPGYQTHELQRCIERPGHYLLLVRWDSVEAHEVGFRKSPRYQEWKRMLHHFYDPFPTVLHYEAVSGAPGIELDHVMVPARDKVAAARLLAELLGVPWSDHGVRPFAPVYVSDSLTLDFDEWPEPVPQIHFAFRVAQDEFDAILERLRERGIAFRSAVHGPVDHQVDTAHGGSIVYWSEPDGHQWEMLTVSYARPP